MTLATRQQYSPLCDLHHTSMRRLMLEEDSEEVRSYHACTRRDCTRVFREVTGYSDFIAGEFDNSRSSARPCARCGAILYLSDVDGTRKIETWECPQMDCDFSEEHRSPSGR